MSKIIVAGAGHGGVVAAINLAKAGHDVLIFEKNRQENLGLPQSDVVEKEAFYYADIPIPTDCKTVRNEITFIPLDSDVTRFTLPATESESILIDRKILITYLLSLAEDAGARVFYDTEIIAPIILGNRVCGVKTLSQDFYCDLVIDACGVYSPLRKNLPEFMCVNREIKKYDIVHTYRAYFNKIPGVPDPETTYNIYVRDNGSVGFSWLVTEDDRADALIGRFHELDDCETLEILRELHEANAHMGTELVKGGSFMPIPVCQPLAVLVADGYTAIGDSAFMTYSIKGSGVAYCIRAGVMLSECIINDTEGFYDAEHLWEYEKRFFKEIGFSACRIAIVKNLLHYMTAEQLNDLFKQNIVTTDEVAKVMEEKFDAILTAKGFATVKDKVKLVRDNPLLKDMFTNIAVWIGRFTVTESSFPNKYDYEDVRKWNEKYNAFFDSIRAE